MNSSFFKLIGVFISLATGVLLFSFTKDLYLSLSSISWPKGSAVVVEPFGCKNEGNGLYEYTIDGVVYSSSRVGFDNIGKDGGCNFTTGQEINISYHPTYHSISTIYTGTNGRALVVVVLFLLALFLAFFTSTVLMFLNKQFNRVKFNGVRGVVNPWIAPK